MILNNRLGNFQVGKPHGGRRIFRNMPERVQALPDGRSCQRGSCQRDTEKIQNPFPVKDQNKGQNFRRHGHPESPGERKHLAKDDQQQDAKHPPAFPRIFLHADVTHDIGCHDA